MLGTIKFSSKVRYGRNKRGIPYYLFIPSTDKSENAIVVASKQGNKTRVDHYATIDIINSTSNPIKGAIRKMIGPVNEMLSSIEYTLFRFDLLPRKPFKPIKLLNDNDCLRVDFRDKMTMSIDPSTTKDIDDAFHFTIEENNNSVSVELGIHITDLSVIDMDGNQFMDNLNKSQTIYSDYKNWNLFDESICEKEFSLLEGQDRNVISLLINFDVVLESNGQVSSVSLKKKSLKFIKAVIKNRRKLSYERADRFLKTSKPFISLKKYLEIYFGESIIDSHDLIAKMMIHYNSEMAKYLKFNHKQFLIRTHKGINFESNKVLMDKFKYQNSDLFKKICYHSAEYSLSESSDTRHYGLGIDYYSHSTSPLRRFNDYIIQKIFSDNLNSQCQSININTIKDIINETDKKIKRAYYDMRKLKFIDQHLNNPLSGYEFEAIVTRFGDNGYISIYINDLDIVHSISLIYKIDDILDVKNEESSITITHKRNRCSIKLNLLDKVRVKVMVSPYEATINRKIRFFLKEPNILDLMDE